MKIRLLPLLGLLGTLLPAAAQTDPLAASFAAPPQENRPWVWWQWVNGNVSREGITADLEAMRKVGIGGASLGYLSGFGIPAGPVQFNTDEWRGLVKFSVQEAARLGLGLGTENISGWSSSGGAWIDPAHSMRVVVFSEVPVASGEHFHGVLPPPATKLNKPDDYRDIAVLAFPTPARKLEIADLPTKLGMGNTGGFTPPPPAPVPPGTAVALKDIVDLTAQAGPDGTLDWTPPSPGGWTIVRFGSASNGQTTGPATDGAGGLEVDKLSREAFDTHWAGMLGGLKKALGPLMGEAQGLSRVLIDSYEVAGQDWTPKLREEFTQRRGYDLLSYLPVYAGYTVESPERTERFLWDLRRTIADLFAENYYDYFTEVCHRNGLLSMVEPYGNGPFETLRVGRDVDQLMTEFWPCWPSDAWYAKQVSSSAHVYGKKFVGAEALTEPPALVGITDKNRWMGTPYDYLPYIHQAFADGVNHLTFHRFAHQPWPNRYPGMTMGPFGSFIDRTNTWWDESGDWMAYISRSGYLLQQGNPVADVLRAAGENAGSAVPDGGGLPSGVTYDACPTQVIMDPERLQVRDGRLVLPEGTSYRVLLVSDTAAMTPAYAQRLLDLAQAGAPIVLGGTKPNRSPSLSGYPECDAEVKKIADALWAKGKALAGKSPAEALAALGVTPDFEVKDKTARVFYAHRATDDADIYFVSNQKPYALETEASFRVTGRRPELWHPDTGAAGPAPAYADKGGRTALPLRLPPYGAVFVVFRGEEGDAPHPVSVTPPRASMAGKLAVQKAVYRGRKKDAAGAWTPDEIDVTAKIAPLAKDGTLSFLVNDANLGLHHQWDEVYLLTVDYTYDGVALRKAASDSDWLDLGDPALADPAPDYRLRQDPQDGPILETWQPGAYKVPMSNGGTVTLNSDAPAPVEVSGGWNLRFPPNWGAPASVALDSLISWSDSPDAGVKYFSGTATYTKTIDIPAALLGPGKGLTLDLGAVKEIARVRLNGKDLGVLWKKPFRVDITGAAQAGPNQLEIDVTNLWPNRLIGDEQLPPDMEMARSGWIDSTDTVGDHPAKWPQWLLDGKPSPTGRLTVTSWRFWKKESPLLPSGLLGPVFLRGSVEQRVE